MADKMVLMHGPAFDGSGDIVEREIHECDVPAYVAAGYVKGSMKIITPDEAADVAMQDFQTVGAKYTEEEAKARIGKKPAARKKAKK